jgi:hypothetical protein
MRTKKTQKVQDYKYYGFNVKILSNERSGTEMYESLIKDMFFKDIVAIVGGEKAMTLRTQFSTDIPLKKKTVRMYYGNITRYTTLDGKNWYDKTKKDFTSFEVPLNIFPNGFETEYVFVPDAHRFFIRVNSKVSITAVERYLIKAIPEIISSKEDFSVNIIQSQDVIEKIINSKELNFLKVEISYTNDDIGDAAQELMDRLLKNGQVGKLDAIFKPNQTGVLDTSSQFIRGVLELAKENGNAEASIRNANGKKERVVTSDYPEKIIAKSQLEDTAKIDLVVNTMRIYRDE